MEWEGKTSSELTRLRSFGKMIMNQPSPEYIAYEGNRFTIEWFYDGQKRSAVLDYFKSLPKDRRAKLGSLLKRMGDTGLVSNITQFRSEGDQIYAFKVHTDRFLCFFYREGKIILTNAFEKKKNKLPAPEKRKALLYKKDYEYRVEEGSYYENL